MGGGEIDLREIESIHRIFVECLAEDNLRAISNEKIGIVIERTPCIVERRDCVPSRVEKEFFEMKAKSEEKLMVPLVQNPGDVQTHKQIGLEKLLDRLSGVTTRLT